jgi:hypothetical protein
MQRECRPVVAAAPPEARFAARARRSGIRRRVRAKASASPTSVEARSSASRSDRPADHQREVSIHAASLLPGAHEPVQPRRGELACGLHCFASIHKENVMRKANLKKL